MSTAAPTLTAYIEAVGLLGPGLSGWPQARTALRGGARYEPQRTLIPLCNGLPPAERRRAIRVVNLALAVAYEAAAAAESELTRLPTVFASSGADSYNCHELLQTLATQDRQVSPTRFHNSVHNAAAGYWSIASQDTAAYTMVCAYDGSFSAGLLEALSLVATGLRPVMLVAYDVDYPSPLREKRPIGDAFGVALLLRPSPAPGSPGLACALKDGPPTRMDRPEFEQMRLSAPAARALPLLELIARGETGGTCLEYLGNLSLVARITPCP